MEITIGPTHKNLISGLTREDIRTCNTCWYILEAYFWTWLKWCCCNTNRKSYTITFSRIVRHRICSYSIFWIMCFQREDIKVFPNRHVIFSDIFLIEIFIIINAIVSWNLYLCIRTWNKVHVFSWWKLNNKFFDERTYVFIRNDSALPLFYTHNTLRNFNL